MKKFRIILIILVIALIVAAAFVGMKSGKDSSNELSNDSEKIYSNALRESEAVKANERKNFTQIDLNKYLEMYEGQNQQIVLIARPTCQYCQVAEPIIQNVMYEYNIDINYLNTDDFGEDGEATLVKSDEYFSSGLGTPTLIIVGGSKIISTIEGLTDKAHYIEFFKQNGYIK